MDIRQLRYFTAVADAGSFTRAASRLNVAQSALSLHIRRMEERLGTALLVRERTGVVTTEAGSKLRERASAILRQIALVEEELGSPRRAPAGEVAVGIPSGAAHLVASELLALAERTLPGMSFRIVEGMTGSIEEWLADGRVNLALLYRPASQTDHHLELARERFCLIASRAHHQVPDEIEFSDIAAYPLALPAAINSARRSVAEAAARLGHALDVRFEVDSLSTIVKMVAEGKIFSILTPAAIQKEIGLGMLQAVPIINPAVTRSVVLAVNPSDEWLPAVSAARRALANVVRSLVERGHWPASLPD